MLLKIPTRTLEEEISRELLSVEIDCGQRQIKKISNQLNQIKYVICYKTKEAVSDGRTIRTSVKFLREHHLDLYKTALSLLQERSEVKAKYPVHLQFAIEKKDKDLLEKDLSFLGSTLRFQIGEEEEFLKSSEVLLLSFAVVELHQDLFCDFLSNELSLTTDMEEISEETVEADEEEGRCCGVCGTEVETRPFSFYASQFTGLCSTAICQKCCKFFEMSLNTSREDWRCLQQSGYCRLKDCFEYSQGTLLYNARDGTLRKYVSNCNVLCKLCRYSRCEEIGMREERERCQVCGSQQSLTSLQVCQSCVVFLSDSVFESSHTSLTCPKSGTCQVTPANTRTFSACPACWISRLDTAGVLQKYLTSLAQSEPDESEKENEEQCLVCEKRTVSKYKERTLCETCKKFFLKCVKSLCFKDFYCGASSQCDLRVRSPCPHCWWSQCVKIGLYQQYQARNTNTNRRTASLS